MELLLRYLPMLVCPIIMGLMMWAMSRKDNSQAQVMQQGEAPCHIASGTVSPLRQVWNMVQCCVNWKVLAGMAVVGVGLWLVVPGQLISVLPVMLLLLCPLSMLLMLRSMNGSSLRIPQRAPELPAERMGGASGHE